MKNIERILFDLDGTLWDTQRFHAAAEVALMKTYSPDVVVSAEDISARYAGRPTKVVFMEVLRCTEEMANQLAVSKWERIFPTAPDAEQLCNVRELFLGLTARGKAFSIGTASPVKWARDLLEVNNLLDLIDPDAIIGGDMVANGKPDPEIWKRAAMQTSLDRCLVVEDGIAGIEAAVAAGIPSVLLLPRQHPQAFSIRSAIDILQLIDTY